MKKAVTICLLLTLATSGMAGVDEFLANSNQFGYQGTVYNATNDPTGSNPWVFNTTDTGRDATVYFTNNVPLAGYAEWGNYNQLLSNWYQHPASNQNHGFFQLSDCDNSKATPGDPLSTFSTVTSATGAWTQNGSSWDFTLTVTGTNADMHNAVARLWQPDRNIAYGGTYTTYTYTISATGMETQIIDGWRYNTTNPSGITGAFDGTFFPTQDVFRGPEVPAGDTYVVHLDFDKNLWDATNFDESVYGNYSEFGAPIPEPVTLALLALGGLLIRKRK